MRINHNIAALNTYRQLGVANAGQQSSMEKLSSGLRINRAGDDAAGLAISEKMRAQVRGLDQAASNAQDGISLIQTAEGALSETHDILQRMRELATQAANDTNTDSDRGGIQKEINQLTSEINRIGNTTEFNTQSLLRGGEAVVSHEATVSGPKLSGGSAAITQNASVAIISNGKDEVNAEFTISKGSFTPTGGETVVIDLDGEGPAEQTLTANVAAQNVSTDLSNINDIDLSEVDSQLTLIIDGETISDIGLATTLADNTSSLESAGHYDGAEAGDLSKLAANLTADINTAIDTYNNNNGKSVSHITVGVSDNGKLLEFTSGTDGDDSEITFGAPSGTNKMAVLGFTTAQQKGTTNDFSVAGKTDEQIAQNIVSALNTTVTDNFDATANTDGTITLIAKDGGSYEGTTGNTVEVAGTAGATQARTKDGVTEEAASGSITFSDVPTAGASITIADKTIEFFDSSIGEKSGSADYSIDVKDLSSGGDVAKAIQDNVSIDGYSLTQNGGTASRLDIVADDAGAVANLAAVGSEAAGTATVAGEELSVSIEGSYAGYTLSFVDDVADEVAVNNEARTITVTADLSSTATMDSIKAQMEAEFGAGKVSLDFGGSVGGLDASSLTLEGDTDAKAATGEITFTDVPTAGTTYTVGENVIGFYDSTSADSQDVAATKAALGATHLIDVSTFDESTTKEDVADAVAALSGSLTGVTLTHANADGVVEIEAASTGVDGNDLALGVDKDVSAGYNLNLQIGANASQSFAVNIEDMRSQALNISGTTSEGTVRAEDGQEAKLTKQFDVSNGTSAVNEEYALDVTSHENATAAISVLDDAINQVSGERSKLGAYQNRLDHTINNLGTSSENLTAAESRIRDVDYAEAA